MAPTRRDALRTAALLCGLGGLAGCAAEDTPSANETNRRDGEATARTGTESTARSPTDAEPTTVNLTSTPTATEQPPTEPPQPDETAKPEQSTDATTDATSSHETSPKSPDAPPPDGQVRSIGGVRVAVSNPVARKAVTYQPILGSGGVLVRPDRQFVVAAVRSATGDEFDAGAPPGLGSFSLIADSGTFSAVGTEAQTTDAYNRGSLAGRGTVGYAASRAEYRSVGWVVFEPPSPLETGKAQIRCRHGGETATWSLPSGAVETLAKPAPSFELRSFDAKRNGSVELSFVAANTSDVDGEFLAAVYWPTTAIADDDESIVVRREVAAGDRVEWSKTVSTSATGGSEDGTVTARIDGVVTGEASVAVPRTTV
ncbi:hypothetical protein [Halococcus agarilyticus]|uniref:hypothetical protein n=1 Tax=Halococcus agarilyticus TaxID=1232219 RepID=UPI000677DA23|nr:hypothetical protein [Halococcus agarilyticus]